MGEQPWLHDAPMSNPAAGDLVSANGTGDGTYFVRPREGQPGQYVLCVVYKGKPTHHLMVEIDGTWVVNKKKYGDFSTMDALITALQSGNVPKWPVPLKHMVTQKTTTTDTSAAPSSSSSSAQASTSGDGGGGAEGFTEDQYYHKKTLSKTESGNLVTAADKGDGTFLVYDHSVPGQYILCVVYKGKPTHHLIMEADGKLLINKKAYVEASSLNQLVTGLSKPGVPKWPVPLSHNVAPPKVDPETEARAAAEAAAAEAAAQQAREEAEAKAKAEAEAAAEAERQRREAEEAEARRQQEAAEEEARKKKEAEEEAARKKAEEEAAAKAEADRVRRVELFAVLNKDAIQPMYESGAVAADAQAKLDAARHEALGSRDELFTLVKDIGVFKHDSAVPASSAWEELTSDGASPTVGTFLDKFSVDEVNNRRAMKDPEFAAERRAEAARLAIAEKREKDKEEMEAKRAEEQAAAEAAEAAAAKKAAEDEAAMAKLPKWRQEKLKKDRAAKAAADEEASAMAVPAWKQAILDEKRSKQEEEDAEKEALMKKGGAALFIAREEREREERAQLEERQRQLEAEKQAAEDARRAAEQAERDRADAEAQAHREEQQKIAAMPPWKRAMYLKKKEAAKRSGGSSNDNDANGGGAPPKKAFTMADGVLELLARQRAALAEEEAEAERKANAMRAGDTVNRAWGALGAGSKSDGGRRNSSSATSKEEEALKATVGMFKMKKLQELKDGDDKKKKKGTWGRSRLSMLESLDVSDEIEAATKAAVIIAKRWRGIVARRKLAALKEERLAAERGGAATKIQAVYRGHLARREVQARKMQRRAEEESAAMLAQKQAELQAITQQRLLLVQQREALQARHQQQSQQHHHGRRNSKRSSQPNTLRTKHDTVGHSDTTRKQSSDQAYHAEQAQPVSIKVATTSNMDTAEKLRRIAQRAAQLEAKQVRAGCAKLADNSDGVYVVNGVYINREGSLAHTSV
eukprot:m.121308 g.121308  ORF g.121308 m.121308 type:complete len:979 (-) comp11080_c0_seq1:100-3036(-)